MRSPWLWLWVYLLFIVLIILTSALERLPFQLFR
jgi:hypothetical protein